jgi:hypothetical protein
MSNADFDNQQKWKDLQDESEEALEIVKSFEK